MQNCCFSSLNSIKDQVLRVKFSLLLFNHQSNKQQPGFYYRNGTSHFEEKEPKFIHYTNGIKTEEFYMCKCVISMTLYVTGSEFSPALNLGI